MPQAYKIFWDGGLVDASYFRYKENAKDYADYLSDTEKYTIKEVLLPNDKNYDDSFEDEKTEEIQIPDNG